MSITLLQPMSAQAVIYRMDGHLQVRVASRADNSMQSALAAALQ